MIIDRLYEAVQKNGNVCVGLDTSLEYIPEYLQNENTSVSDMIFEFNRRIIDATYDIVACFKVQIAYYEAYGIEGFIAYKKTLEYVRNKGTIVIADIKRGDISKTAEMYAKAHFEGDFESDFITLNPYMGMDSIDPYLKYVKNNEKGIFVLLRTSNIGAKDIQCLKGSNGKRVHDIVSDKIQSIANNYMGKYGYSSIGGVVGCTDVDDGIRIRENLHNTFFLIPGYGAQGGVANDVALYLHKGNGGIVNSSRGILLAYKSHNNGYKEFELYARKEAIKMKEAILNASKIY